MRIVKEFVPPIFIKLLRKYQLLQGFHSLPKVYDSWQQALADSTPNDYQDAELVEVVFQKTKTFLQSTSHRELSPAATITLTALGLLLSEVAPHRRTIHVLDLGGACGIHYFQCRRLLSPNISLKWCVVETPAMAAKAQALASKELYFVDNLGEALNSFDTIDLLHTSGTLQCMRNPENVLQQIINSNSKFILFNRLGLHRGKQDVITVHQSTLSGNGFGKLPSNFQDRSVRYPFIFMSEYKFMDMLKEKYSVFCSFEDFAGSSTIKDYEIIGGAYLCKKKT